MTDNTVTVIGNLTRDPETGETNGGKTYARLGIANNRRFKKAGSDEWTDEPNFFNVTVWGDLADNVASSLGKGDRVVVFGRLEWRQWETDGEKKSAVQIVADDIAPSLRWATAEVTRTEKQSGGGGSTREDVPPIDSEPF